MRRVVARRLLWCALPVFLGYVVVRGAQRGNDFKYPYNVARYLWQNGRLAVSSQPRYPVTFHVLLAPLASLPIGVAAAIWAILSVAAVAALPRIFERLSGMAPRQQLLSWIVVAPFLIDAFVLGQSDPINLFLVSAGLLAVKEGRSLPGTMLVGMAGMIKFLPILFWTTIVSRRRSWGVWLGMILTVAAGFALVVVAVGWEGAIAGIREQMVWIRDHEKPWHLVARRTDLRPNNESLPIVLARTFGDLGTYRPERAVSLGRWPLQPLWTIWGVVLASLAIVWLISARTIRTLAPERAWLGMFGLTAIVMLASTPICWHHYFLWTLPGTLFARNRPRLLVVAAIISTGGSAWQPARGLGLHMALALALFAVIAHDIRREAAELSDARDPMQRP